MDNRNEVPEKKLDEPDITFDRQVAAAGLSDPETWKNDVRFAFQRAFSPVLLGTEYYFVVNTKDSSAKILELHKKGIPRRIMGFAGKQNMEINAFFNKEFYNRIRNHVELPDNKYPNKSQPHVTISLKTLWNVLCTACGQGVTCES